MLDTPRTGLDDSWLDEAKSRFDASNADLLPETRSLLEDIVSDAGLHPKLMNTLSMLEHLGSSKIMATQKGAGINEPSLKHLAEECHHAYFMKRQAEKATAQSLDYGPDNLLVPLSARMYFLRLEASVVRALRQQQSLAATYLYMSMIVEFRAVWFYSLYQQVLQRHAHPLSLKRLLGEEQNHLTSMAESLEHAGELSDVRVDAFIRTENALYIRFLDSLQQSVN